MMALCRHFIGKNESLITQIIACHIHSGSSTTTIDWDLLLAFKNKFVGTLADIQGASGWSTAQTLQGQPVTKPETPLQDILVGYVNTTREFYSYEFNPVFSEKDYTSWYLMAMSVVITAQNNRTSTAPWRTLVDIDV